MKKTLQLFMLVLGWAPLGCRAIPAAAVSGGAGGAAAGVAVSIDSTAEKMLVYQRSNGGWPKAVHEGGKEIKVDYSQPLSAATRTRTLADKNQLNTTIDNNATTREINYLVEAFQKTGNPAYRTAAEAGVAYLLKMQYANGGFPQYYPDRSGYRHQITYNDNAMIRTLVVLRNVASQKGPFAALNASYVPQAQAAVSRGIDCILKTQYVRNGKLTAWCAQYDEKTLLPDKARAFELASLSGDESVEIVRFLMGVENPSEAVKTAISSAMAWFEMVKMPNMTMKEISASNGPKGKDRVIVPETGAVLWARFYELNTDRPIYVGRDSQVHYQLNDIEIERRAGYLYAGTWPEKLITKEYPAWQKRVSTGGRG